MLGVCVVFTCADVCVCVFSSAAIDPSEREREERGYLTEPCMRLKVHAHGWGAAAAEIRSHGALDADENSCARACAHVWRHHHMSFLVSCSCCVVLCCIVSCRSYE